MAFLCFFVVLVFSQGGESFDRVSWVVDSIWLCAKGWLGKHTSVRSCPFGTIASQANPKLQRSFQAL